MNVSIPFQFQNNLCLMNAIFPQAQVWSGSDSVFHRTHMKNTAKTDLQFPMLQAGFC